MAKAKAFANKRARHAEAERDAFDRRIAELEAQLAKAVDLAAEAIPYVSNHFRGKYDMDARLAKLFPSQSTDEADQDHDVGSAK